MNTIRIKNSTKQGYLDMISGGICDTAFIKMAKRGRAQGNPPGTICPALMAHNINALVIISYKDEV